VRKKAVHGGTVVVIGGVTHGQWRSAAMGSYTDCGVLAVALGGVAEGRKD